MLSLMRVRALAGRMMRCKGERSMCGCDCFLSTSLSTFSTFSSLTFMAAAAAALFFFCLRSASLVVPKEADPKQKKMKKAVAMKVKKEKEDKEVTEKNKKQEVEACDAASHSVCVGEYDCPINDKEEGSLLMPSICLLVSLSAYLTPLLLHPVS